MTPEDIRQLREQLQCTSRELAATMNLDAAEINAWEQGDKFPTKKFVVELEKLRGIGPSAIVRKKKRRPTPLTGVERLSDPLLWELLQKLLEHPDLFDQVSTLAEKYSLARPSDPKK